MTGFTNGEEADVELTDVVPFLVEDELSALGAHYQKGYELGLVYCRRWQTDHRAEPGKLRRDGQSAGCCAALTPHPAAGRAFRLREPQRVLNAKQFQAVKILRFTRENA